jgi:hypothetical protein
MPLFKRFFKSLSIGSNFAARFHSLPGKQQLLVYRDLSEDSPSEFLTQDAKLESEGNLLHHS